MAEYYTSQGDNHLIVEQKYYNMLDIEGFSQMMKDPSYCYKFYWLEAIVHLISENVYQTTFDEIIDEMISNAWYSVREFHIHLSGIQSDGMVRDGLERAVNLLSEYSSLPANASKAKSRRRGWIFKAYNYHKTNGTVNANMHTTEAFLAVADVAGNEEYRDFFLDHSVTVGTAWRSWCVACWNKSR